MRSAFAVLAALDLVLLTATSDARKRPPCPDAAYIAQDAPIVPGDESLQHNGLVLVGKTIGVGGACAPTRVKLKTSKKGTRLRVRFKSCAGVTGPVALKATIDAACTTLTGTLTGRKAKLARDVTATAVPTGAVTGIARIVRAMAVPEAARAEVLANRSQVELLGGTVREDGSAILHAPVGAGGWRVTVGDRETYTRADGTFDLVLDTVGPTEGTLYHPAEDTEPAVVFWLVPHLAAAGSTPVPIDIELETQGACGMDDAPADNPAHCAAVAPSLAAHADHGDGPVTAPVTFVFTLGALGSYPSLTSTSCRDQDGGFGLSGTTIAGALTNYVGSTCDTQVTLGCCDNELGSIKVSIKSALGKLTGFTPIGCQKNHKGRFCDDLLHDDVGAQVPAGIVNASSVLSYAKAVTQPVSPLVPVPVTVHHNACYGETIVTRTVSDLGGTLTGLAGNKVLHYTTSPAGNFTFVADVTIVYIPPPACPAGLTNPTDVYHFEADGYGVDVTFQMGCSLVTTTTTGGGVTTTTLQTGRAVRLIYETGGSAAGTDVCLSRIGGACVTAAHPPMCSYTHLHALSTTITIDGTGSYIDPHLNLMQPCGYGEVVTVSGCGPDTVPAC
ncbi:MAG TPA: hypothetical protein VGR62_17640 [Candidatus Binatia bacterium]|jgi:hypothetical protein|nr:hypothetical protein [Candidatus Binatia bacterium]